MRTFSIKEPEYYRVKAYNAQIDIQIAELKAEIANKKIRLSQLNEAKTRSMDKDLFIDQMNSVRADIDKLNGEIEKLKSRYREYREI